MSASAGADPQPGAPDPVGAGGEPLLRVEVSDAGVATVVALAGEVDLFSAAALRAPFAALVAAQAGAVVVDLTAVPFIDSAGLGQLVALYKRLHEHHRPFRLVVTEPRVLRPLQVMGLDRLLTLDAHLDDALAALRAT